jgi:hypothetical protein
MRCVCRTPPPSAGCSLTIAKAVPVGLSGGLSAGAEVGLEAAVALPVGVAVAAGEGSEPAD